MGGAPVNIQLVDSARSEQFVDFAGEKHKRADHVQRFRDYGGKLAKLHQ
jgi:hypothetical protein